ncbi:MAG TPA: OmpA family protein [Longimicrobiaceae bacterium]
MQRLVSVGAAILLTAGLTSACATKGQLRRLQAEQQAALQQEREERLAAEEELRATLNALDSDVEALRADIEQLRTEFGAQITALEGKLRFAMPIHFGFDEAEVAAEDQEMLNRFASVVREHYGASYLTIEGFADPAGPEEYNKRLSERRAEAVQEYLVQQGLPEDRLRTVGYGESRPVVPGAAASTPGAELNRRVVFVIEGPVNDVLPEAGQPVGAEST